MVLSAVILSSCAAAKESTMYQAPIRPLEFGGELILPGGECLEDKDFQIFFKRSDYVLIGETHTNMTDHMSQAVILEKMAINRLKPIIALEMVNVDRQNVLDRFNRRQLGVNELEKALDWPRSVGYSFELYRPIFEVAEKYDIPAFALNIPRRVVRAVRLNGLEGVAPEDKKYLPSKFIPMSEPQRTRLGELFMSHMGRSPAAKSLGAQVAAQGNLDPMAELMRQRPEPAPGAENANGIAAAGQSKMLEGFINAQALWDSVMAERAAYLHDAYKRPVVLIVGQGHVEYGWGIALRLAGYDANSRITSVLPWRQAMEYAVMQAQSSPLLDDELPAVFPTPNEADIYYYSPQAPIGHAPQGLVTGQNPAAKKPQLMLLAVEPKSAAAKAGLLAGDIILQLDRREVISGGEFYSIMAQGAAYGREHQVLVKRGDKVLGLTLPAWK